MRLTTHVAALARASALASDAVNQQEAKRRFSALGAAQIRATESGATLAMNNLDFMVSVAFAADVEASGAVAVFAKALAGLVAALPDDVDVIIEVRDDIRDGKVVGTASVKSGRRTFKLATIPADELPQDLKIDTETGTTTLPRADALNLFARTCFAAAPAKDARHYLGGLFLHSHGDELIAVATDSYVLARFAVASLGMLSKDRRLIVPTDAAEFIAKLLADKQINDVTLRAGGSLLTVEATGVTFVTRFIDGVYPAYEKVIPDTPPGGATVERAALLATFARAIAVTGGREVDLSWSNSELRLTVADLVDDVIDAEVTQAGRIAVDARRFHDLVTELPAGKRLTLAAANSREPMRLTVEGVDNFFAVLAPRQPSGEAPPTRRDQAPPVTPAPLAGSDNAAKPQPDSTLSAAGDPFNFPPEGSIPAFMRRSSP